MSCPQIWNIEQEKDRKKEKVGGRPAKLNEKKGDRDLEREIKNKGDIFLLEDQHKSFVAAVTKKGNASGHQCKEKMSGSELKKSEREHLQHFLRKKSLEVSRCSRAKQRQRNAQNSVLHVQSCFFVNYTHCCFHRSPALSSPLSITRSYIVFQ